MQRGSTKSLQLWMSCWIITMSQIQTWSASKCATTARKRERRRYLCFISGISELCSTFTAQVWKFKGSIFLTFKTEDAAKAFVGKEEKYKEGALLKKFQKDYLEEKKKEMDEKRNKFGKKDKKPNAGGADDKEVCYAQTQTKISMDVNITNTRLLIHPYPLRLR